MSTLIKTTPVDGSKFHWTGTKGSAWVSDLGPKFDFERVWGDPCAEGLTVLSHKTGKTVVFVLESVEYTPDGDLYCWKLDSIGSEKGKFSLIIFND